jgi:hypothetical protein
MNRSQRLWFTVACGAVALQSTASDISLIYIDNYSYIVAPDDVYLVVNGANGSPTQSDKS